MQAYHARVYGILMGMVHHEDDARDLAQQVWIKVWNKLHTFKGESDFYTWLYRLTTFAGLDFLRKRKRLREANWIEELEPVRDPDDVTAPSVVSRPDRTAEANEIRTEFDEALKSLSVEHRTALILRELEGLSYDEIARVMKCRRGTVMSRIFYARKEMQEQLRVLR